MNSDRFAEILLKRQQLKEKIHPTKDRYFPEIFKFVAKTSENISKKLSSPSSFMN
jgi:hypothetical protein